MIYSYTIKTRTCFGRKLTLAGLAPDVANPNIESSVCWDKTRNNVNNVAQKGSHIDSNAKQLQQDKCMLFCCKI